MSVYNYVLCSKLMTQLIRGRFVAGDGLWQGTVCIRDGLCQDDSWGDGLSVLRVPT